MIKNYTSLQQWLTYLASIHPKTIELGLQRVKEVLLRLQWAPPSCPVIIVGGTNGKGSCAAALEKIYHFQGYKTGVFTSPILYRHNELLRIAGEAVADAFFCEAYAKIEAARQAILLTPFEYNTLAAIDILGRQRLDVWIMEVGLGGRLDAVNILDADLAVISSIGIDHVDYLGDTRELIGQEKAGIFRHGRPVVCGDKEPPDSLRLQAERLDALFYCQGKDFQYVVAADAWHWQGKETAYPKLPFSPLALQNVSTALMAVELLRGRLPVSESAVRQAIPAVSLPGRVEIKPGPITTIWDVAHNPAAVAYLAECLKKMPCEGKTRAVFSMLADKDVAGSLCEIRHRVDDWHVAPLQVPRGANREMLRAAFQAVKMRAVQFYDSVADAWQAAQGAARVNDRVVIFGSFHTVAEAKRFSDCSSVD